MSPRLFLQAAVLLAACPTGLLGQINALTCTANVGVPPSVRAEGLTELVGDLVLQCNGGTPTTGGRLTTANIQVFLGTPITNRVNLTSNFTDSLLLIDDPSPDKIKLALVDPSLALSAPAGTAAGTYDAFSGYKGGPTSLIWLGVPLDPPGTSATRVLRITNVRANANLAAANSKGATNLPVNATVLMSISSNGATPVSVPIANPTQTIGLIQPGLSVSVRNTRSIQNCTNTPPPTSASSPGGFRLRFEEGFGSSFKKTGVRLVLDPFVALTTETGIVPGEAPAAAGTRLRANFKNIPPGVSLFVTSHNVDAGFDTGISIANTVPGVPPNQPLALLPVSNGTATAVWEVINTDPAAKENMEFGVWFSFTGLSGGQALHITSDGGIQDLDPLTIPGAPFTPTVSTFSSAGARPFVVTSIVPCANTPQTEAPGSVLTSTDKTPCLLFNNSVCNPWLGAVTTSLEHDGLKTQATSTDASLQLTKTGGDPPDDHTPLNLSTLIKNVSAQPRSSEVKVSISSNTGTTLNQATFPVTILSPTNPLLIPENYTDVSDYTSGKASPGQIFSIFPKNFSGPAALVSSAIDANGILSNKVDDTQVFFGNDPAALLFVTANQITGIAPNSLAGKSSVPLKIVRKSETSPIINLPVVPSSLAIVSADGSGGGACACLNSDGSFNSQSNPAPEDSVIVLFGNYGGATDIPRTEGRTTIAAPYPKPAGPISATIGGRPVTDFLYYGNLPGFAESAQQWNIRVPKGLKPGPNTLQISAGGATSASGAFVWIGEQVGN